MENYLGDAKFITFEGGEGSGKTTVIKEVEEYLTSLGYDVLVTREPGGVKIAEQIREVILDKKNTEMDPMTEVLLYVAARREHLVHKVLPALESGKVVLCDRFVDSSLVYQGYTRGIGIEKVWEINKHVIDDLMPDKTVYLDVSPEVGLSRIHSNDEREKNRLDLEGLNFHKKVREGYLKLADMFKERILLVNAEQDVESVVNDVKSLLKVDNK